ncbi:thioredoxin O1, mitochondrial isoform X5 [Amborella trichopoda]|uniref:thioredoxin O1, mitochondrial isoform X5 n=1 Tax=Amborella trichopoda TaxID=13333 RepID=UPI0009BEC1C5|nr:thioredoxin O1, mitochondrial isoform X5 [Amborella trichopoda]|eukprot:XP_020528417.1 thioredoxin O1, mitochondrial isoform X5 [Amborella trichopoda]
MRISLLHRIVRGRGSTRMCTAFLHSSSSTPFIPPTNIPWRPSYSFEHHYSFPSSSSSSIINPRLSFTSPPHRALCSSTSGTSDIVTIKSDEEFESSIKKVQDDSLPAIFYFTAVWCGPCCGSCVQICSLCLRPAPEVGHGAQFVSWVRFGVGSP